MCNLFGLAHGTLRVQFSRSRKVIFHLRPKSTEKGATESSCARTHGSKLMELMSESSQVVVASVSSSSTLFIQRSCKKKSLYYAINTNSFAETAVRVFGTGEGSFQPHAEFSPQCAVFSI